MRLALDPAALAWALSPLGAVARAALLEHDACLPADALVRLRDLRPAVEADTALARGELWDLLQALLARVEPVELDGFEEFLPLAKRLVPSPCAPSLALALAMDVRALLAGGPEFGAQDLVPVIQAWPRARQTRLQS